ncbi:hypothetical protein TruAng_007068 [Truncatella angustata]|nr:hypothetical protein TruAng_007068 [Truncatella angustata]
MLQSQFHSIALAALALSQTVFSTSSCDCWMTKDDGLLFTNYKGINFRSLAKYAGPVPALITGYNANARAGATSAYFKSSAWANFFSLQTWGITDTPVKMVNSPNNAFIQNNTDGSTYLTLRTYRTKNFQSAVEADSVTDDYTAVSLRYRSRVHGNVGACAGAFTYKANNDTGVLVEHESDLEILTSGPTNILHYTTHPEEEDHDNDGSFSIEATDRGKWTNWQDHRLDWTQPKTTWYLNGKMNGELAHEDAQFPSSLIFNMWSTGSLGWEGTMPVGGSAYFDLHSPSIVVHHVADCGFAPHMSIFEPIPPDSRNAVNPSFEPQDNEETECMGRWQRTKIPELASKLPRIHSIEHLHFKSKHVALYQNHLRNLNGQTTFFHFDRHHKRAGRHPIFIRYLLYANEFNTRGTIATTSIWLQSQTYSEAILSILDTYGQVFDNLNKYLAVYCRYGKPKQFKLRVASGSKVYSKVALGEALSDGTALLIASLKESTRPLFVSVWGGTNTLAQALDYLTKTRSVDEFSALRRRLRVHAILDQDDTGEWIRQTFPDIYYIFSNHAWAIYPNAAWQGMGCSGIVGANNSIVGADWLAANIQSFGH